MFSVDARDRWETIANAVISQEKYPHSTHTDEMDNPTVQTGSLPFVSLLSYLSKDRL